MRITIHNVGHGSCISLIHDNGNVMLWDCGQDEKNKPSQFLLLQGISKIDNFFVTNYDEDHISDLPDLRSKIDIKTLFRNKSISPSQLQQLKLKQSGEVSYAMRSMLNMMESYNSQVVNPSYFPEVHYETFYNKYKFDFDDTNNISLVTFLKCKNSCFIIPGDLEEPGWKHLLKDVNFKNKLRYVDVFIASHHGRESGYCKEVFEVCNPKVIVFSDNNIKYNTQEMASIYANHATGIIYNNERRRVLSTRKDGSISWNI